MRTYARLTATTAAVEYHTGASRLPVAAVRIAALKNAADAWPLGKLDVDGRRTGKRGSPDSVGRIPPKRRLTPWLTTRLSAPINVEKANDWRADVRPVISRPTLMSCQMPLKSPTALAALKIGSAIGCPRSRSSCASPHSSNDSTAFTLRVRCDAA